MKLEYGQKLMNAKGPGRPKIAYVLSKENDHLVKLCYSWPYIDGDDSTYMVNEQIERVYTRADYGSQMEIIGLKSPTRLEMLTEKYLGGKEKRK